MQPAEQSLLVHLIAKLNLTTVENLSVCYEEILYLTFIRIVHCFWQIRSFLGLNFNDSNTVVNQKPPPFF